jgi:pimeloyl-ACP methyl ester carboxylesterase
MAWYRSVFVVLVAVTALVALSGPNAVAQAEPAQAPTAQAGPAPFDFVNPQRDPAQIYPSPAPDPWVVPAPGYEGKPAGTVLASRPVVIPLLVVPTASSQLLLRSTDSHGNAMPIVTTVMVPTTPWPGPGARPVIAYNTAIDSLGLTCVPSWTLPRAAEIEVVPINTMLAKNYAVVVTDHQGPHQAYAGGRLSGHAVLDAVRATVQTPSLGLTPNAPVAITGYSGGAIAAGWAAELAPTYAPDLNVVGAAIGGAPVDYRLLFASMNGTNLASAVFLAASLGVAREYPELLGLMNDNAWRLGVIAKDWCLAAIAPLGIAPIPVQALSDVPNVVDTPIVRQVLDDTTMGRDAPRAPVLIYQGQQDVWIPREGAVRLRDAWCAQGANVRLDEILGEHLLAVAGGMPLAFGWIDDRIAGRPVAAGCR